MPALQMLSSHLEATILHPTALPPDVHRVVTEAIQLNCPAVVVAPVYVARVKQMMQAQSSGVSVITTAGYPFGTNKSTLKAIEATSSIKDGADGIDVVPHLVNLLREDFDAIRHELLEIVRAARSTRREVRIGVIIEAPLLEFESRISIACRAVRESGCDGIVTAGGVVSDSMTTPDTIRLLKPHCEGLSIKAAGVLADADVQALLEAGADRIGTSNAGSLCAR